MVDEDVYCMDIMKQIKAVQGALDRVNAMLLDNHMQTCVARAVVSEDKAEQEKVMHEITELFTAAHRLR